MEPSEELLGRVERLVGSKPVAWKRGEGGYSTAERFSLDLADGRRVFAKRATTENLARYLRDEHRNMTSLDDDFRCEVIAWEDAEYPLLVLEDLRDGHWPPPWEAGEIDRMLATLERIWSSPVPEHLPSLERIGDMFSGWETIARDPAGFLSLNIASRDWLEECLPTLIDAAAGANIVGDDFLHLDARSDNMCFFSDRVVFVDWNWAARGPRDLDLACALPPLRLEGGPLPDDVKPGLGSYASGFSAFMAANAYLPPPETAPTVRKFQLRQLRISLPWACRELGLRLPDVAYGRIEVADLNKRLDANEITEAQWHAAVQEVLIDAYLAAAEPQAQSGKSGDEAEWRWSRELILDVFPKRAAFLDVGCANGYLMESVHRWGAERGITVEPYGLDISWRIATLARDRLPHWRDRIFVGDVATWDPPRRFDVVQIGIDEVRGKDRQRALIERVLRDFLEAGGKLVFRAARANDAVWNPVRILRDLGFEPEGIIEAPHPETGELRVTAWLSAR